VFSWRDDVTVWDFNTGLYPNFTITLVNTGDGPVVVSQVFLILSAPKGYNVGYPISRTLGPGETFSTSEGQVFSPYYEGYISSSSGTPSETTLEKSGSPWPDAGALPCFGEILFSPDSLLLGRYRDYYKLKGHRLVEDQGAQAFVVYYSIHTRKEIRKKFPVVVTFVKSLDDKCSNGQ
jgi:hypothetical protein